MSVRLILAACAMLALSGVPGLGLSRRSATGQWIATVLACAGATIGLFGAGWALSVATVQEQSSPWSVPGAELNVAVDGIAVIFLLPILLMTALGSIYGMSYWRQAEHSENGRGLRFFYGLLAASMIMVVLARNSVLFLLAWEVMALSAFFLVTTEDEDASVRRAGWLYLIATHIGTLFLIAMFAVLRSIGGSFAIRAVPQSAAGLGALTVVFVLALLGFGIKAGIMPLHVWLPSAHANAPTHVSAMLSGVVIKMGIYGLVRITSLLSHPPPAWGAILLILGAVSCVLGVAFAIGQHDLKRLLAYHSIENIGIIAMGLGLAMLGRSMQRADWIVLGLGGALLHVWNHCLFKSLLFFGAGSVVHCLHTRDIDRMGGLGRAMPLTMLLFIVGSAAICGLPPLNGFVSELLIYLGLFGTLGIGGGTSWMGASLAVPALAMAGALAGACFVKVVGAVFLGQPRTEQAAHGRESSMSMISPMFVLASLCFLIGLMPGLLLPLLDRAGAEWMGETGLTAPALASLAPTFWLIGIGFILILIVALWVVQLQMRRRTPAIAVTWDCGYAAPTPRMQYSASSFGQMIVDLLSFVLRPQTHRPHPHGPFPKRAGFRSHVDDVVLDGVLIPTFRAGERLLAWLRVLQSGRVQLYVLYVLIILVGLLLWILPLYDFLIRLFSR